MPRKKHIPNRDLFCNFLAAEFLKARISRGFSLRDVSHITGLTHTEIHRIESAVQEIRLSTFIRLCAGLKIPAWQLIQDAQDRLEGQP
jgi:transcriptional regulator with XRE-family HTH domain